MSQSWRERWFDGFGRLPTERELAEVNRAATRWLNSNGLVTEDWKAQIKRAHEAAYRRRNAKQHEHRTEKHMSTKDPIPNTNKTAGIKVSPPAEPTAEQRIAKLQAEIATLKVTIRDITAEREMARREARELLRVAANYKAIAAIVQKG